MQRAHIVKPVGQLHQQDSNVAGGCEDELLEVLGLSQFLGAVFKLVELRDPIDQFGHIRTKAHFDIADIDLGVLDHIVKEARDDGDLVELDVSQKARDFNRMRIIRIARIAHLFAMMRFGKIVSGTEKFGLHPRVIGANLIDQLLPGQDIFRFFRSRSLCASHVASPFILCG